MAQLINVKFTFLYLNRNYIRRNAISNPFHIPLARDTILKYETKLAINRSKQTAEKTHEMIKFNVLEKCYRFLLNNNKIRNY